ncbi:MAG: 2-phospho-L-lactate transferase CofD family protein [Candidatus Helarchaeota archaeon]
MLLIFYSGTRISNILYSIVTYLPQDKLGFVYETSNIINLSGIEMNLCLRALLNSLMRVRYPKTYRVYKYLKKFGLKPYLQFTDLDIAISIYLTELLSKGAKFYQSLNKIRNNFSIDAKILPLSETPLPITIKTLTKSYPLIDFYQAATSEKQIQEVLFNGAEIKKPNDYLKKVSNNSEYILLLPNDLVAFHAMLLCPGIKKILQEAPCPIFAIYPIVDQNLLSPENTNILTKIGYSEINALEFSKQVENLADIIIIHENQKLYKDQIQDLGFQVYLRDLKIKNKKEAFELATFLFNLFPLK